MPRKAQPRKVRPSGIQTSANGKYYYWKCNVSGLETFADEKRFKDVVKNYGSEETLFKTYVLRPVQKYVDAGFDAETIKSIAAAHDGKMPPLGGKKVKPVKQKRGRKPKLKSFAVGTVETTVESSSGVFEQETKPVYPWSNDPDYFKSQPIPASIEAITVDTCVYPNRYMDDACYGCPVYDKCVLKIKYTPEDWKKPRKGNETKVKELKSFE